MKKISLLVIISFIGIATAFSQNGMISLEDIWTKYAYYPAGIDDLRSLHDGAHYTINDGGTAIAEYDYKTGNKTAELFNVSQTNNTITGFLDYTFNDDESALLLTTDMQYRYRNATLDEDYVFNLKSQKLTKLSDKGRQMYANFSPAGNTIAYVIDNNLYYKNLTTNTEVAITNDGKWNSIINGGSDWVYEEEFTLVRSFEWSPDGKKIAYYKFDESDVPEFELTTYKGQLYPQIYSYKYPKVGEKNSKVSLYIYDIASGATKQIQINEQYEYIPRIKWTPDGMLCITILNRLQNDLQLLLADATTGATKKLFHETSSTYIEINDDLTFLNDNKFIWKSEMDGYYHLYIYDMTGKLINQITKGKWDVAEFKGYNKTAGLLYYMSTEDSPMERHLYAVKTDGTGKKKLTTGNGVNTVNFSEGYKYYINTFSNFSTPDIITLHDMSGKEIRVLEDNKDLQQTLTSLNIKSPELFTFMLSNGTVLNGYMIKPYNFDPVKKYPVFMTVYGGPGSQEVLNEYDGINRMWHQMLAQKGYIIACVDNRGTGSRGRDFRTCTYKQLGKLETDDQIEAAKYLGSLPYVDPARIGIWGWSYGGYMAGLCITRGADVFKTAISVAPVTNWKYYDNIYTERYMGTLETNPTGYDGNAPMAFADKLEGNYLLVHGTGDDNVHFQNSIEWINALIANNKQFDLMIYPDRNHGIYGGSTRMHLFTKLTDFVLENL